MFARLPGVIAAGGVINVPVTNIDIAPTIFEATHIDAQYEVDGVSWWSAVTGGRGISGKLRGENTVQVYSSWLVCSCISLELMLCTHMIGRDCIISEIDTDRAVVCVSLGLK